jgi:hypothetical protein
MYEVGTDPKCSECTNRARPPTPPPSFRVGPNRFSLSPWGCFVSCGSLCRFLAVPATLRTETETETEKQTKQAQKRNRNETEAKAKGRTERESPGRKGRPKGKAKGKGLLPTFRIPSFLQVFPLSSLSCSCTRERKKYFRYKKALSSFL